MTQEERALVTELLQAVSAVLAWQLSICTCEYCQSARLLRAALAAFPAQPESKS